MQIIATPRLILRTWQKQDAEAYYQINQDPDVIAWLRGSLTLPEVNAFMAAANQHQQQHGYTLWAVELEKTGELIGFIGLNYTDWKSAFTPAIEIGWRLGSQHWGKGYATEGATAALNHGFNTMELKEIVSFTVPANVRSIRVMEKIGLQRDVNGDFAHPKLPADHRLSQHILYRLTQDAYHRKTHPLEPSAC